MLSFPWWFHHPWFSHCWWFNLGDSPHDFDIRHDFSLDFTILPWWNPGFFHGRFNHDFSQSNFPDVMVTTRQAQLFLTPSTLNLQLRMAKRGEWMGFSWNSGVWYMKYTIYMYVELYVSILWNYIYIWILYILYSNCNVYIYIHILLFMLCSYIIYIYIKGVFKFGIFTI